MFRGIVFFVAMLFALPALAGHPAEKWTFKEMNDTINQTNFIVRGGCSGTLISLKYRLLLTNHHCLQGYFRYVEREVVKDGVVTKVRKEERRDIPVVQKAYKDFRIVGSTSYMTQIVARKQESDLALLQIRAENLPYTIESKVLPDGIKLYRGEKVYVVGNPRGLDATVTAGIISSLNRMFRVPWANGGDVSFIQIDAAVNPGNSGGSLYNEEGYLIGVPGARLGDSALGLAIPYTLIQVFLTENCYESVWKTDGETYEDCTARKEAEADE